MSLYKKYLQQEANTNHPIKNTILVYRSCIGKLQMIKNMFEQFKFIEAEEHLDKLEMIMSELKLQVNEEADMELAENLYDIYDWVLFEISEMKRLRIAIKTDEIVTVLTDLMEAFETILRENS